MQNTNNNAKPSMAKNERRRGRPVGKDRVPLSLSERRARNAQYEKERRCETGEAMAQLAVAAGCDPQITNPELLATVVNRFQIRSQETETVDELRRMNEELEAKIAKLTFKIESDPFLLEIFHQMMATDEPSPSGEGTSHCDPAGGSSQNPRPRKIRKTSKRRRVHEAVKFSQSHAETEAKSPEVPVRPIQQHVVVEANPNNARNQFSHTDIEILKTLKLTDILEASALLSENQLNPDDLSTMLEFGESREDLLCLNMYY